jgi:hypothetical protein
MGPIQAIKIFLAARKLQAAWEKSLWRNTEMGWKTIAGALIVAASGALGYLESVGVCSGCGKISEGLFALGTALGLIGLRHAIAKEK